MANYITERVLIPVSSDILSTLAGAATSAAQQVGDPYETGRQHFTEIAECLVIDGAGNIWEMLDWLHPSVRDWVDSIDDLSRALTNRTDRSIQLASDATYLIEQKRFANTMYADYWYRWEEQTDRFSPAELQDTSFRDAARQAATDAADEVRSQIQNHNENVEQYEIDLANAISGISGGTRVSDALGEVNTSQDAWGSITSPYPGAPYYLQTTSSLADMFNDVLGDGAEARIRWMANAAPEDVERWLLNHPDFMQTVGFIPPFEANQLFTELGNLSTRNSLTGEWSTGPLAALFAMAPGVIGNLNGIRATDKNEFNREALRQLLESGDLDEETIAILNSLQRQLDKGAPLPDDSYAPVTLLTLFFDQDGKPRASLGYGDLDNADQIVTTTHGIETDLTSLDEWAGIGRDLLRETNRLGDANTAVIVFMEWDSGTAGNVWGVERPNAGAERLTALVGGFASQNPDAIYDLVVHSLGTTMATQAIVDNPDLFDHANFVGSAGISELSADALQDLIRSGKVEIFASHAGMDNIARWGQSDVLFNSEHPVDPLTILDRGHEFSSEGGYVEGFDVEGLQTQGHNATYSTEFLYRWYNIESVDIWGNPIYADGSNGYLDRTSEAFMHVIVNLVEAQEDIP